MPSERYEITLLTKYIVIVPPTKRLMDAQLSAMAVASGCVNPDDILGKEHMVNGCVVKTLGSETITE